MTASHTTILQVTGMTCGNCVKHVTHALNGVAGVSATTVDLAARQATVEHEATVRYEELIAAVDDAGYAASSAS